MPADNPQTTQNPVKVFISYSHDSQTHIDNVCALANRLVESEGMDVMLDLWEPAPKQGWPDWMLDGIEWANYVLVVCTATYYQRARKKAPEGEGKGVKWEALLTAGHIYQNNSTNTKFIPIFLSDENIEFIPEWLRNFTYYNIATDACYDDLIRHLTAQPQYIKPQRGKGRVLPPKSTSATSNSTTNNSAMSQKPQVNLFAMPTSSGTIVGRESEVEWLNNAWDDPNQSVVSIIAWGGVGKTSLINHWLNDMRSQNFKGAQRVFAHSFYSQGTSDQRTVSAEHFINEAFKFLGYNEANTNKAPQSLHEKGLLLAELFCHSKTLLVLDGLEPMQHPLDVLNGKLKDSALEVLIKQLAFNLDGLCVITSRVPVYELANRGEKLDLQHLSIDAGKQVLENLGVSGPKQAMENAVTEVQGHALTLCLLGGYLEAACGGDINKRDTIPNLVDEPQQGQHAKHVMHSYQLWLEQNDRFEDVNVLFIIALFDRPVEMTTINALLAGDAIIGVTDKLKALPATQLKFAISRLVKLQLITENYSANSHTLDSHPLVREHFANSLKAQNPSGYKQAHSVLYEYYKQLPDDELPETLAQMQPLFNAISHGCKAGLYQQALDEVYWPRIRRGNKHFINKKLGAFATNLACIAHFFDDDNWATPTSELNEDAQAGVLNWAAFALRGLGRLHEAVAPFIAGMELRKKQGYWKGAAVNASNASELYLTLGQVNLAVEYGALCVEYADKSDDWSVQMITRTTYADALFQRAKFEQQQSDFNQAEQLFIEAEQRQQKHQPQFNYLYSVQGYRYCSFMLKLVENKTELNKLMARVETTLGWVQNARWLLDVALDQLTLGKAYLLDCVAGFSEDVAYKKHIEQAQQYINSAVDGLRKAGQFDYLLKGLLTRASFFTHISADSSTNTQHHKNSQNHQKAWQDLDEVYEIATFGDMRLHLCDYHIEVARNIASQLNASELSREIFLVIENGKTINPSKNDMKERLQGHIKTAEQMINDLPYHFRDDDLAEVKDLAGG